MLFCNQGLEYLRRRGEAEEAHLTYACLRLCCSPLLLVLLGLLVCDFNLVQVHVTHLPSSSQGCNSRLQHSTARITTSAQHCRSASYAVFQTHHMRISKASSGTYELQLLTQNCSPTVHFSSGDIVERETFAHHFRFTPSLCMSVPTNAPCAFPKHS